MDTSSSLKRRPARWWVLPLLLGGGLLGAAQSASAHGIVLIAPPVALVEPIGVAPVPGYVWIGGYWGWFGGRYVWVPGRWSAPRVGYRWVPHEWRHVAGGWRLHDGHWSPARR